MASNLPASLASTWERWNRDIPTLISGVLVGGFLCALVFHRRLTSYRISLALAAVVGIAPIVAVQRVVPYERIWLFLLPLYLMMASAGVLYVVMRMASARGKEDSRVSALLALAAALGLGFEVVRSQSVYYANEGSFRDAEPIVAFLKERLRPGDQVVAVCPSDAPLKYYLKAHRVSLACLSAAGGQLRRLLVIVNDSDRQTLEGVLKKIGQERALKDHTPELLNQYESAKLYEIRVRNGK